MNLLSCLRSEDVTEEDFAEVDANISKWMTELPDEIKKLPLAELAIPGTTTLQFP